VLIACSHAPASAGAQVYQALPRNRVTTKNAQCCNRCTLSTNRIVLQPPQRAAPLRTPRNTCLCATQCNAFEPPRSPVTTRSPLQESRCARTSGGGGSSCPHPQQATAASAHAAKSDALAPCTHGRAAPQIWRRNGTRAIYIRRMQPVGVVATAAGMRAPAATPRLCSQSHPRYTPGARAL
jgi:hypothetical protein